MYGDSVVPRRSKPGRSAASKTRVLLRELGSDDDSDEESPSTPTDAAKPWLKEFNQYMLAVDDLRDGVSIVQWWGVC